jgi:hypothetical protein
VTAATAIPLIIVTFNVMWLEGTVWKPLRRLIGRIKPIRRVFDPELEDIAGYQNMRELNRTAMKMFEEAEDGRGILIIFIIRITGMIKETSTPSVVLFYGKREVFSIRCWIPCMI